MSWEIIFGTADWLYTTGKKYGIFFIWAIFVILWCLCVVFLYLIYIPTFGELIHTQLQNEPQRFKNNYFGHFSLLDAG